MPKKLQQDVVLAVHTELSSDPNLRWSVVDAIWKSIPFSEKKSAIELVTKRCQTIFGDRADSIKFQTGIEQRLYQVRRTWQQTQRTASKRKQEAKAGIDDVHGDEPRTRPFDPVRD
jgi:hypothetical protein